MRDLGVVAARRDAGRRDRGLQHGDRRRRHPQTSRPARAGPRRAAGPGWDVDPSTLTGPRVGHRRRDRAEADPERDVELAERARRRRPRTRAIGSRVRRRPARGGRDRRSGGGAERQARPGQLGEPAVDDLEGRPPGPVVEQRVAVELDDRRRRPSASCRGRRRGGVAGVDPAVERGDEDRRDEVRGGIQPVEGHRRRIGPGPEPVDLSTDSGAGRTGQASVRPMTCPSGSARRPSFATPSGLNFGMTTAPPSSAPRASVASMSATVT